MRALAANISLKVVSPQVEALRGQNLAPVLKALWDIGVWVLPGRGVGRLPVFACQAQELVGCVRVEAKVRGVCKRGVKILLLKSTGSTRTQPQQSPRLLFQGIYSNLIPLPLNS